LKPTPNSSTTLLSLDGSAGEWLLGIDSRNIGREQQWWNASRLGMPKATMPTTAAKTTSTKKRR